MEIPCPAERANGKTAGPEAQYGTKPRRGVCTRHFDCKPLNDGDNVSAHGQGGCLARKTIDVVGLGLNATDTVMRVREFPPLGGKERLLSSEMQAGGQVATALVTCQRLGLRTRYIGKVGDDDAGKFQLASLRREGVDTRYTKMARRTPNQIGVIIVDEKSGERTVFWDRHPNLAVKPHELDPAAIQSARALHLDDCDVEACCRAAGWARAGGIPVVADLDTVYPKVERLFPLVDYLIASANLPPAFTGIDDPLMALESMARKFKIPAVGVTLGRDGALLYSNDRFHYAPGFMVKAVDTTGAGDVFHGSFVYGLLRGWELGRILDFSNAMAALNCTRLGARGGIATRRAAEKLMAGRR